MKKLFVTAAICILASISCFAQYTTTYRNQYGSTIGSSSTSRNYGGGYSTTYRNQYGSTTGSSTTSLNYGGGSTTTYRNQYGITTGTATTTSDYGSSYTTTIRKHDRNSNHNIKLRWWYDYHI